MTRTVCILAAGLGSRMGEYAHVINKALLPIEDKAAISHIINNFEPDYHFVIALGFQSQTVIDYLELAHPEIRFTFCHVDPFQGPGSGPGTSLAACEKELKKSFFLVCCDTLWEKKEFGKWSLNQDWLGTHAVSSDVSDHYCNLKVKGSKILAIHDKKTVSGSQFSAWIGLAHIKNWKAMFSGLKTRENHSSELQLSAGFQKILESKEAFQIQPVTSWADIGTVEKYSAHLKTCAPNAFVKKNEFFYHVDDRVVKFFSDSETVKNRVQRAQELNPLVPEILSVRKNFYSYRFIPGATFYEKGNPILFSNLLNWLSKELWQEKQISLGDFAKSASDFYEKRTKQRIRDFLDPKSEALLAQVPWKTLCVGKPVRFHGDLQFDNIIVNSAGGFSLIDWRQDFGGTTRFGDLYYDLAKLKTGIEMDFAQIKIGCFQLSKNGDHFEYEVPAAKHSVSYLKVLDRFVESSRLDRKKLELTSALVLLNMSALHSYPLNHIFYLAGLKKLDALINAKTHDQSEFGGV